MRQGRSAAFAAFDLFYGQGVLSWACLLIRYHRSHYRHQFFRISTLFGHGDLIDLDTRLAEEVSRLAAGTQVEKDRITAALNNPDVTSDPEQLAIWQNKLSAYTIDTSLYSTLARKGVSAIETLIKT